MEIDAITSDLDHTDTYRRLKAVAALKEYDAETAIPLLVKQRHDTQYLVRSFVAMGLGKHQTDESFTTLLAMLETDPDANVKAEAANSLSLFGDASISHLVQAFHQNENWLIRHSILAALLDLQRSAEILEVCIEALSGQDLTTQETAVEALGSLADSEQGEAALPHLLRLTGSEHWSIRMRVAQALRRFKQPLAREALIQLIQDNDPRVVAAALME
jgi:HEAT repeat protein